MKPRAVININGEELVMDGFYKAYHRVNGLVFAVDTDNRILEIQNLNENKFAKVFNKEMSIIVAPSEVRIISTFYFNDSEFNFVLIERQPTRHLEEDDVVEEESDEYYDCND